MHYIAYLKAPEQHCNLALSHPGYGESEAEARENALYCHNQEPFVEVVPASVAPRWAHATARSTRRNYLENRDHRSAAWPEGRLRPDEKQELQAYRDAELHFPYCRSIGTQPRQAGSLRRGMWRLVAALTHLRVCRFLLVCRWPCCKRDCGGPGQEAASPGIPQETPSNLPYRPTGCSSSSSNRRQSQSSSKTDRVRLPRGIP